METYKFAGCGGGITIMAFNCSKPICVFFQTGLHRPLRVYQGSMMVKSGMGYSVPACHPSLIISHIVQLAEEQ